MYQEESAEAKRQQEVFVPGHFVAAERAGEPMDLGRLIHREAGDQASRAHDDDGGIRNPLSTIVFGLRRKFLAEVQIDQQHLDGVFQALPGWKDETPLAGVDCVQHIENSIDGEKPHEKEMVSHAAPDIGREDTLVEPGGEESEKRKGPDAYAVDSVRMQMCVIRVVPVDQDAAPNHREQHGKVDPMHPANRERMLSLQANPRLDWRAGIFRHSGWVVLSHGK